MKQKGSRRKKQKHRDAAEWDEVRQTTKESLIHFMKNINTICTKNFHRVVKQLSEYEDILDKYSIQSSLMDDAGENSKKKYKSKFSSKEKESF